MALALPFLEKLGAADGPRDWNPRNRKGPPGRRVGSPDPVADPFPESPWVSWKHVGFPCTLVTGCAAKASGLGVAPVARPPRAPSAVT